MLVFILRNVDGDMNYENAWRVEKYVEGAERQTVSLEFFFTTYVVEAHVVGTVPENESRTCISSLVIKTKKNPGERRIYVDMRETNNDET